PLLAACGGGTIGETPTTGAPGGGTTPPAGGGSPVAGATGTTSGGTTGGKTLTIAMAADPKALDPQRVLDNSAGFVMSCVYDRIVHYRPETTEVAPGLAERWDVSDDGKTYTFHLRQGVKFHDGSDFNAAAWVSDLDRILKQDNPHYIFKDPGVQSFAKDTYGLITDYKATDDSTVQVTLSAPFAPFLANLAMVWSGLASQKALQDGVDLMTHPIGTGPFSFVEWQRNDHITLKANPNYWGEKPKLDGIVFRIVPEAAVRVLQLKNNEVQIIADLTTDDIPALKDQPGVKLVQQPGLTVNGIAMSCDKPPFDNVKVRQALNYAVNKEEMVQALYAGVGQVMNAPVPPTDWSYDKSLPAYPFDPNKAKQLLQEAGWKPGTQVTLLAYQNPRGYNPAGGKMAVAIQQYLGDVGVNVKIETLDFGAFLDKRRSFNWEGLAMAGWSGDNGDPDNFLYALFSGPSIPINNAARWKNDQVDQILTQAREETDHDKRLQLYQQAEKIIHDECPWIWVNYTTQTRAIRDTVQGFTLNPTQMFFDMEKVSIT
ncbi:MAG: ABC transporter substrate-binding protein, partial [Thermomicrobiaceae bacterium]|nr:ABC transporter substrate-binding protein [Thermomicrobiaceae bacterium]